MRIIECKDLRTKIDCGIPLRLVNALEPHKFRERHIPDSINVNTKEEIIARLNNKDDFIVVYCSDHSCNKSILLYYLLESMGYRNVWRFPGGLLEWEKEGYPFSGERTDE